MPYELNGVRFDLPCFNYAGPHHLGPDLPDADPLLPRGGLAPVVLVSPRALSYCCRSRRIHAAYTSRGLRALLTRARAAPTRAHSASTPRCASTCITSGDAKSQSFDLDELRLEGPWPGSREQLVDRSSLGCTLAEIYPASRQAREPIFSLPYCSLFGEWLLTDEAKQMRRTQVETVRLPLPRAKVRLVIKTRDKKNRWRERFQAEHRPGLAAGQQRAAARRARRCSRCTAAGPSQRCLDIVFLGDGYQAWQMDKFRQDARRFSRVLLDTPPFAELKDRINIWAVESPSRESGVDEPRKGIFRDTALSMSFNTLGSSRYLMTTDQKAVRDVAANAPYDAIVIISNTSRYGGGGIYNSYASFVSDNEYDEYTLVHEFGHSLGGLGDEYYTSSTAYNDVYPEGRRALGAEHHRRAAARARSSGATWSRPTRRSPRPEEPRYAGKVGLFEGAGYSAKGLFRPALDCKMFDKGHKPFCPVCARAVEQAVLRYAR